MTYGTIDLYKVCACNFGDGQGVLEMKTKCRMLLLLGVMLCCIISMGITVQAKGNAKKRILFISSYSVGWRTVQLQIEGIQQGLADENVILDYEFMDTMRVNNEVSKQMFYEGLKYRMSQSEPYDAIITGDDPALKFALEYQHELFEGIPIVFLGVNDVELAQEAARDPMISGVTEQLSFEKNIDLAKKIYPKAKKVVGIFDNTLTGIAEREAFYDCAELYPELEFSEINASELTNAGLKMALRSLEEDTILFYVMMTEDASGNHYVNEEAVELITTFSRVPTFRMVEGGIGLGLLGGNIVSMQKSGEIAADLALGIVNGTVDREETGIVASSPNIYYMDEQVLKEFGISLSVLPEETVLINHEPSFIERNKEVLRLVCVLMAAVMAFVIFIMVDNIKRRKLTKELEAARNVLENASQHDFLTGLPNRSKFMADLQEQLDAKKPCTVVMMDVDNFKYINDTFGHAAGDEALQEVAARLQKLQTPILTPYRFAGDEFIIIIRSNNRQIVEKSVVQTAQVFQKKFSLVGISRNISGSIGVASYPEDTTDKEQLIVYADAAMYEVKKNGKNAFVYYKNLNKENAVS